MPGDEGRPLRRSTDTLEIPEWLVMFIQDGTKVRTIVESLPSQLTEINIRLGDLVTRREFDAHQTEASRAFNKLDTLWDQHQRLQGQVHEGEVRSRTWRWGMGIAVASMAVIIAFLELVIQFHIHFSGG